MRWVLPIVNKEVRLKDVAILFPGGKRTLERWVSSYKKHGEQGLVPRSTRPRSNPNETPIRIKERIIEMRNEEKLCSKKLNYRLEKEGIHVSDRLIGKLIKKEGLVRRYRTKKLKYKYIKVPLSCGDLVEIDIKYVPDSINGLKYYQFTAIDCASRWRYLKVYDGMGNDCAIHFLEEVLRIAPFRIRAVKTDNGTCFTNYYVGYKKSTDMENPRLHGFDIACMRNRVIHYLIDPGKPAQNGKVERSHRTDQEMFYDRNKFKDINDLERKIRVWNDRYNDLEHCGLKGKTPNEMVVLSGK